MVWLCYSQFIWQWLFDINRATIFTQIAKIRKERKEGKGKGKGAVTMERREKDPETARTHSSGNLRKG
jgi:hypothetical protein